LRDSARKTKIINAAPHLAGHCEHASASGQSREKLSATFGAFSFVPLQYLRPQFTKIKRKHHLKITEKRKLDAVGRLEPPTAVICKSLHDNK